MKHLIFLLSLAGALLTMTACSSTTLTGSWVDPAYNLRIDRVYIIGMSKQDMQRRMFEDEFASHLEAYGVTGIPSYRDLPEVGEVDQALIDEKLQDKRVDAILITRVLDRRTEETVYPGHATYRTWPHYYGSRVYHPAPYYHNYWSYFDRGYDMLYTQPVVTRYRVITAECNLYDANTGDLVWSAQLETIVEKNFSKRMTEFIETVINDLARQGLI